MDVQLLLMHQEDIIRGCKPHASASRVLQGLFIRKCMTVQTGEENHAARKGLNGFVLAATDEELGKITDLYFDDQKWAICHWVADTGNWLESRKVLISPLFLAERIEDWRPWHASCGAGQILPNGTRQE